MTPMNFEDLKKYALEAEFIEYIDQCILMFKRDSTLNQTHKAPIRSFIVFWYNNETDLPVDSISQTHYQENIAYLMELYKEHSTFWTMEQL